MSMQQGKPSCIRELVLVDLWIGPTVSISGLSLIGGMVSAGAIYNARGNVTMRNCEISGNNGNNFGSGITNAGTMVLLACGINSNLTDENGDNANISRFGGGIYNTL
jgi:hypothetical protein